MRTLLSAESRRFSEKRRMVLLTVGLALTALIALGVVALWWVGTYHNLSVYTDDPAHEGSSVWSEDDVCRALFLNVSDSRLAGAVIVCFDPAAGRVTTVPLPTDTLLFYRTAQKTLAALYTAGGPRVIETALDETAGLELKGTAVLSPDRFGQWVERCKSGVPVVLDEPLETAGLSLDVGRHTLTASQARQYLFDLPNSESYGFLLHAMARQYFAPDRDISTEFDRLSMSWDPGSTLRRTDFIADEAALTALAAAADFRTAVLPGHRTGEGSDSRFVLPDDMADRWEEVWG